MLFMGSADLQELGVMEITRISFTETAPLALLASSDGLKLSNDRYWHVNCTLTA
jgi:hypothetical protein